MNARQGDRVHVYRDHAGEWRWRLKARNGRIIATAGEGYVNRLHAIKMARSINPTATFTVDKAAY